MSETKTPGEKKLSVSKLTLKPRAETGVVRQSFSHGRSKQVVVEKVKRRFGPTEAKVEAAGCRSQKAGRRAEASCQACRRYTCACSAGEIRRRAAYPHRRGA